MFVLLSMHLEPNISDVALLNYRAQRKFCFDNHYVTLQCLIKDKTSQLIIMEKSHVIFGILFLAAAIRFSISWKMILFSALVSVVMVLVKTVGWLVYSNAPNPFASDSREPRKPYISDSKLRDAVLKQGFHPNKVMNEKWDAIVIGSGIGGMTAASILAKTGKKVLVLEQHDQAGGCCHTYVDKGSHLLNICLY